VGISHGAHKHVNSALLEAIARRRDPGVRLAGASVFMDFGGSPALLGDVVRRLDALSDALDMDVEAVELRLWEVPGEVAGLVAAQTEFFDRPERVAAVWRGLSDAERAAVRQGIPRFGGWVTADMVAGWEAGSQRL
jgi:hypothetical protein